MKKAQTSDALTEFSETCNDNQIHKEPLTQDISTRSTSALGYISKEKNCSAPSAVNVTDQNQIVCIVSNSCIDVTPANKNRLKLINDSAEIISVDLVSLGNSDNSFNMFLTY